MVRTAYLLLSVSAIHGQVPLNSSFDKAWIVTARRPPRSHMTEAGIETEKLPKTVIRAVISHHPAVFILLFSFKNLLHIVVPNQLNHYLTS